jgi:anaerobic magnesium-protoporphyrin IX monomethyl ester cyclase
MKKTGKYQRILLLWPYKERTVAKNEATDYGQLAPRYPLGMGFIKYHLRKHGYNADFIDCTMTDERSVNNGRVRFGYSDSQIESMIREAKPDVVGISQMFSFDFDICRNIFSLVRKIDSDIITVWGGTHPTVASHDCLNECADADYLVIGEGEMPFLRLLDTLNEGGDIAKVKSIGYRTADGKIAINSERDWLPDLDSHVLPYGSKEELQPYYDRSGAINFVTSRGCPFSCMFCTAPQFYKKHFYARSPQNVADEMELLVNEYGFKKLSVEDEIFTYDMDRVEEICSLVIEKGLKFAWVAESGLAISKLNYDLISKMKQAGFAELRLALESGDIEILKKMKKPVSLSKAKKVMKWVREIGIRTSCCILVGFPGETEEQMRMTIEFAKDVGFDWTIINIVVPLPGTQINMDLAKKGIKLDFSEFEGTTRPPSTHELPAEKLLEIKEYANFILNFEHNYNLRRGDSRVAEKDFSLLLEQYDFAKMWFYYGISLYKNAKPSDALQAFKKGESFEQRAEMAANFIKFLQDPDSYEPDGRYLKADIEKSLGYDFGRLSIEKALENEKVKGTAYQRRHTKIEL